MRRRFRYDPDLDAVVEIRDNYFEETSQGPSVISDDVGAGVNGLRHMPSGVHSDSKSWHRRETKARGLEEVGTQTDFASKREPPKTRDFEREVHTAQQQIDGNYNGTRDWLSHRARTRSGEWS